jgi:predicted hydrolase (HD superfamily)
MVPTPEEAYELVCEYNKEDFHRSHARIVGDVMRWMAEDLGYGDEADYWQAVGILHDLDFEQWPDQHCVKSQELMREKGIDEDVIRATASHGWGMTDAGIEPEREMEKVLFAVDELTGLIGAAALMRPSKSVDDMQLKSVKKKFKDKSFAAGCSRDTIRQGADMLGWTLDELMEKTLAACKASPNVA